MHKKGALAWAIERKKETLASAKKSASFCLRQEHILLKKYFCVVCRASEIYKMLFSKKVVQLCGLVIVGVIRLLLFAVFTIIF